MGSWFRENTNIVPQSSESKPFEMGSIAGSTFSNQNVDFEDATPGYADGRGSQPTDSLRDSCMTNDATLDNFFSRPIKIAAFDWNVDALFFETFDPWSLYWQNARVINRISNYKLLRSTMKVKVILNGNSFYYGRVIATYQPLPLTDNVTVQRSFFSPDVVEASQRPHIYLNPTNNQGGTLSLPFFTPLNLLDIVNQDWNNMGTVTLFGLNTLRHANGGTGPVSISVFAWAENVKFSIPTQAEPGSIVPQASEQKGIISKPASIVAKIASTFKSVPIVSQFATATELGARSIATMAALFGYSKPTKNEFEPFQPCSRQSMALGDGCENILRLTLDSKQELSIDPAVAGIGSMDEMTILSIACRESYLTSFQWDIGLDPEELLFNTIVDPCVLNIVAAVNDELHFPACAFAAFPFENWKGSLRYRFQIIASGFHKGRMKIVYDPFGTPIGGAEYNTAYTTIIDISDNNDFCIDVGWGQSTPFREHMPSNQGFGTGYSLTRLTYAANSVKYGNGTLSVYVVNELTVPDNTLSNDVQVNVFVSALDDFEVAAPSDRFIKFLQISPPTINPEVLYKPQSEETGQIPVSDSPISDPVVLNKVANETMVDSLINRIHYGETIVSFRNLLKRYVLHEVMIINETSFAGSGPIVASFTRTMYPYTPGYTTNTPAQSSVVSSTPTGNYAYANNTLMNYLSLAYGGKRGGVRYTTDATFNAVLDNTLTEFGPTNPTTWSVSRIGTNAFNPSHVDIEDSVDVINTNTTSTMKHDLLAANSEGLGISGLSRWNTSVNPITSFEVPFYSIYRFAPAKVKTDFNVHDLTQDSYQLLATTVSGITPTYIYNYVAAAEDFNLIFYLGPPIMYVVANPSAE